MIVSKCDSCGEKITDPCDMISVEHHCMFAEFDFCHECAGPIARFLDRKGLITSHSFDGEN